MSGKVHPEMAVSGESQQVDTVKAEVQEVEEASDFDDEAYNEREDKETNRLKQLVEQMRRENEADRLQAQQRRAALFVKAKDEEKEAGHDHGKHSWQSRLLHRLHHHYFQGFLICLLLLDVVVVVVELFLEAQYPDCDIIKRDAVSCVPIACAPSHHGSTSSSSATASSHSSSTSSGSSSSHGRRIAGLDEGDWEYGQDAWSWPAEEPLGLLSWESRGRLLSGDSHGPTCKDSHLYSAMESAKATCDEHKYGWLHTVHHLLVGVSVFILGVFFVELILLFTCLGCGFFKNPLYIADLFIVSVSLILEFLLMSFTEQSLVSLMLFARFWRFVRVAHGLITSVHEPMSHKCEHMEDIVEQLNTRNETLARAEKRHMKMIDFLLKDSKDPKAAKAAALKAAKAAMAIEYPQAPDHDKGPRESARAPEGDAAPFLAEHSEK